MSPELGGSHDHRDGRLALCGLSGDFNWFHIDAVAAKESVFGQRVAHGMLVASIATGLQVGSDGAQDRDGRLHGAARVAVPRGGLLRRHDPRQADDRREDRAQEPRAGLRDLRGRGDQPGRQGRPEGSVEHADPPPPRPSASSVRTPGPDKESGVRRRTGRPWTPSPPPTPSRSPRPPRPSRVSERTVWRYLKSGRLPGETVGEPGSQRTLIPREAVDALRGDARRRPDADGPARRARPAGRRAGGPARPSATP